MTQQASTGQIHHVSVRCLDDPFGGNRAQPAIGLLHYRLAIHGAGTGPQQRRVDHVAGTAGMHHQLRVRQLRDQLAGTAGMIQMHVGEDQPVHLG